MIEESDNFATDLEVCISFEMKSNAIKFAPQLLYAKQSWTVTFQVGCHAELNLRINFAFGTALLNHSPIKNMSSRDEDGLRFNWSCVVSEGGRPCAAELLPAATTAAFLREAGEYEFILTVSKYSRGSWRSASTSATINVACVL